MRIWLAMLVAPSLALAAQGLMFALVTPSCSGQSTAALHGVALVSLAMSAVFTLLARREWGLRASAPGLTTDSDGADPSTARRFLAAAATAVGALSCLTIAAMWIAVWVLSPCWQ